MASFEIAYNITNASEGGQKLSLDPDDSGNWTGGSKGVGQLIGSKYGVSAPTLSSYLKRTATASDMKNLSLEMAMDIAKKGYWNPISGDYITSQQDANRIYDSAYNKGVVPAIKLAQTTLGVALTGKMDAVTLNALNNK